MLDEHRKLRSIIHQVSDVTEYVRVEEREGEQRAIAVELRARAEQMQAEILNRSAELEEMNQRMTVTDTGHGIDEDSLAKLFVPFERLDAAATGVEGTGLGLALSRTLVEAMGGTLGVDSTPGVGSSFWVELSRQEPAAVEHDAEGAQHLPTSISSRRSSPPGRACACFPR